MSKNLFPDSIFFEEWLRAATALQSHYSIKTQIEDDSGEDCRCTVEAQGSCDVNQLQSKGREPNMSGSSLTNLETIKNTHKTAIRKSSTVYRKSVVCLLLVYRIINIFSSSVTDSESFK